MTRDELAAQTRRLVAEHLEVDPEKVVEGASFVGDLGADSLDTFEIVLILEDEFDVEISDDEVETILTFGDAVSALAKKLAVPA